MTVAANPKQVETPDKKQRALQRIHESLSSVSAHYEKREFGPETFKTFRDLLSRLADRVRKGALGMADLDRELERIQQMVNSCVRISEALRKASASQASKARSLAQRKEYAGLIQTIRSSGNAGQFAAQLDSLALRASGRNRVLVAHEVMHTVKVTSDIGKAAVKARVESEKQPVAPSVRSAQNPVTMTARTESVRANVMAVASDRRKLEELKTEIAVLLDRRYGTTDTKVTIDEKSGEVQVSFIVEKQEQVTEEIVNRVIREAIATSRESSESSVG